MSRALDSWDDQPARGPVTIVPTGASSSALKLGMSKVTVVRDDWEDDDDENENENEDKDITDERNKQIWEDANTRVHYPMPSVVLVQSSTSAVTGTVTSPSLPLNQPPPMRILKRPSPAQSTTQSAVSNNATVAALQAEALKERERKYQEARERIFGATRGSSPDISQPHSTTHLIDDGGLNQSGKEIQFNGKKPRSPNSMSPTTPQIIREPRGPGMGSNAAGFGGRRIGPS